MKNNSVSITLDGTITVVGSRGKVTVIPAQQVVGLADYVRAQVQLQAGPVKPQVKPVASPQPQAKPEPKAQAAGPKVVVANPATDCHRCGAANLEPKVIAWAKARGTFGYKPTCMKCQDSMRAEYKARNPQSEGTKYSKGMRCQGKRNNAPCHRLVSNQWADWSYDRFGIVVCPACYQNEQRHYESVVAIAHSKTKAARAAKPDTAKVSEEAPF